MASQPSLSADIWLMCALTSLCTLCVYIYLYIYSLKCRVQELIWLGGILWSAFWICNCLWAHLELAMLKVCLGSSTLNTWAAIYLHWSVQAAWVRTKPRTLPSTDQDEAFVVRLKHLKVRSGFSLSPLPFRSSFFCSLVVQGSLGAWFKRHLE